MIYSCTVCKQLDHHNTPAMHATEPSSSVTNSHCLGKNVNKILHRTIATVLQLQLDSFISSLSQNFATFFSYEIHRPHTSLLVNHAHTSSHLHTRATPPYTLPKFSSFIVEVSKLLTRYSDTYYDLDITTRN